MIIFFIEPSVSQHGPHSQHGPFHFCDRDAVGNNPYQHVLLYRTHNLQDWDVCILFNTLRLRQNGRHFANDNFKCSFLNGKVWISITISLKFVHNGPINSIPALVQIIAWPRPGDKTSSEPMMVSYWRIYASLGLNELTLASSRYWMTQFTVPHAHSTRITDCVTHMTIHFPVWFWNVECAIFKNVFFNNWYLRWNCLRLNIQQPHWW